MIRRVSLAVAASAAVGFSLLSVPAHAVGTQAPTPVAQRSGDHVKCTSLDNGQLCIVMQNSPQSITTIYTTKDGASIKAHLGYRMRGTSTYDKLEKIDKNDRATSTWTMSWPCNSAVGLLKLENGKVYETPSATFPGC